jgi:hypothetical protein
MARLPVVLALLLAACAPGDSDAPDPEPVSNGPSEEISKANVGAPLVTIEDASKALRPLIERHYPEAEVTAGDDEFHAKAGTMVFRVHGRDKAGKVSPKTWEVEGPNYLGFQLRVVRRKGVYGGAAALPQTFRRPYWETWGTAIYDGRADTHLHLLFSYGCRVKAEFREAVHRLFSTGGSQLPR